MAISREEVCSLHLRNLSLPQKAYVQLLLEEGISPREHAFQSCLSSISSLLTQYHVTNHPRIFISYAWEAEGSNELRELQDFLKRFKADLELLGLSVFLDLNGGMVGTDEFRERMRAEIQARNYFVLTGTPLYKQKALDNVPRRDNVAFEYDLIKTKRQNEEGVMLLPIWWRGNTRAEVFPAPVAEGPILDFKNSQNYYTRLVDLVQHIYPILAPDGELFQRFRELSNIFENRLRALETRQQYLLVQFKAETAIPAALEPMLVQSLVPPQEKQDLFSSFLLHVVKGEQKDAEVMLKTNKELVLFAGHVTDLSGRTFQNITAFQYAVWALDWHMWQMLLRFLEQHYPEEVLKQATQFEIGNWVREHKVHAAHLLKNLAKQLLVYIHNNRSWSPQARIDHWIQKVGKAQRAVPAHVINEYCNPTDSFNSSPSLFQ